MSLTEKQIERYNRHIILEDIGQEGQEKLLASKVLVIGAGGLGSPVLLYLAAAGIGTIGIIDGDKVELTNLQRQIIHNTSDVAIEKVKSAKQKINQINPDVKVKTYNEFAKADNIRNIISDYDFVVESTDNFPAKFLINDACYFENKPFSHAGILKFYGQLLTVIPGNSTCYRCVFNSTPPQKEAISCSRAGVFGIVPGVIGSLQATEAVKYILNLGQLLTDKLLSYDALTMSFRTIDLKRNPKCPLCGEAPEITQLED